MKRNKFFDGISDGISDGLPFERKTSQLEEEMKVYTSSNTIQIPVDDDIMQARYKLTLFDEEAENFFKYRKAYNTLWEYTNYLRKRYKYEDFETEGESRLVEEIYDRLFEIAGENDYDIWS